MDPCHAFSTRSDGLLMQLHNEVYISANGQKVTVRALWDTGATMSAISHSVAEDLKLVPIGKQIVATPTGSKEVDTFCVDTMLPNNVNFEGIIVIDSEIGSQTAGCWSVWTSSAGVILPSRITTGGRSLHTAALRWAPLTLSISL